MRDSCILKTMKPHNRKTGNISLSEDEYLAILKGEVTTIRIFSPEGKQLTVITNPDVKNLTARSTSYGTYYLLRYK